MEYWERIKALREDNDITQTNIARHLNIARTHTLNMRMEKERFRLVF